MEGRPSGRARGAVERGLGGGLGTGDDDDAREQQPVAGRPQAPVAHDDP